MISRIQMPHKIGSKQIKSECFSNGSIMPYIESILEELARAENQQMLSIHTVWIERPNESQNSGNAQAYREIVKCKEICLLS
jgi:hypothetical protein